MRIFRAISIFFCLPFLFACTGGGNSSDQDAPDPGMLVTVPSDAVAIASFDKCSDAIDFLPDSTDILKKLDLSALGNARCILSYCNTGSLSPILTIDAGNADTETPGCTHILTQCSEYGLQGSVFHGCWGNGTKSALCISPSHTLLEAVRRHINSGTSIMDAPFFEAALNKAGDMSQTVFLRNTKAALMLPRPFFGDFLPRRQVASFIGTVADWTILEFTAKACIITTYGQNSDKYFANLLDKIPSEECRICGVLPRSTDMVISLATPHGAFREAYENYLDANTGIESYRKELSRLSKACRKAPVSWEEENMIDEIARVHWEGREVLAARSGRKDVLNGTSENLYRGYIKALYGSAFSAPSDSVQARFGEWMIFGSAEDVSAFVSIETRRMEEGILPSKIYSFMIYEPGKLIYSDKKGERYGVSIGKQAY